MLNLIPSAPRPATFAPLRGPRSRESRRRPTSAATIRHALLVSLVLAVCVSAAVAQGPNKFANTNGHRAYLEEHGWPPPVLLPHGGTTSVETWSRQLPSLAARYRVTTMDARGHGRSGDVDAPLANAALADDVIAASHVRALADVVPGAAYVQIPETGHFGHLKRTEEVNAHLPRFLRDTAGPPQRVDMPRGRAPRLDGILSAGEWEDAARVAVELAPGWNADVRFKHDGSHLYFAFSGLWRGSEERYPEVLLDMGGNGGAAWDGDDHWFHASYRDCDATGKPNIYASCDTTRPGWSANNFPLGDGRVVEARIAFGRIGLVPGRSRPLGFAFNLTDTRHRSTLWPAGATLDAPATWAALAARDRWGVPVRTPGVAPGRVDTLRVASTVLGDTLALPVYLPPGYDGARRYPAVYAFLGQVYFAHPAVQLPLVADSAIGSGLQPAVIVGLPPGELPGSHHPDTPAQAAWQRFVITEVIPAVERRYAVERDRRARTLLGFSSGGNVVVDLAARHPDRFARVAVQSPGWMDWDQERAALGRVFVEEALTTLRAAPAAPLPAFWFVWGDGDMEWEARSRQHGARIMELLRYAGATVERANDVPGEHGLPLASRTLAGALRFLLREEPTGART